MVMERTAIIVKGHADPLVRGMAVWALSKLAPINKIRAMADYIE